MVFQARLEEFRTVGMSCYTLTRSLLGDFDFTALQDANQYMGPILFIIFVVLAVFVVLNMLIAIISNAYDETCEELEGEPQWDLLEDIKDYFVIKLLHGDNKRTLYIFTKIFPQTIERWGEGSKLQSVSPSRRASQTQLSKASSNAIHPEDDSSEMPPTLSTLQLASAKLQREERT